MFGRQAWQSCPVGARDDGGSGERPGSRSPPLAGVRKNSACRPCVPGWVLEAGLRHAEFFRTPASPSPLAKRDLSDFELRTLPPLSPPGLLQRQLGGGIGIPF